MADHGEREGQQLGNYLLVEILGRGNFADVYLGQHVHLHTQAAIKVLHGRLTDNDLANFINEARVIAHLRHPHIVQVLDFGVEDTTPFLVMDYAPNGNLRLRHPKGSLLPLETVISYVRQIAEALQYAHDQKLIHRDIKPENMLLGRSNEVLLSDFGIAMMYPGVRSRQTQDAAGTVPYMAPEQLQAHAVPASDQYALGIVTYEWLCGERPFSGSLAEIAIKHALLPPPSLREKVTTISPAVEQVVLKVLAKNPHQRFEHIQQFALALEEASRLESPEGTLPLQTDDAYYSNLPAPLTSLIGREQEILAVCTLLRRTDVRIVTLTGTGGIGKTRLSLEVATELLHIFSDGVYFIPLDSISDATLVIPTIAHTLGLKHSFPERQPPVTEHMEYLKTSLREKHCLLLLDNFEQVVTAAPDISELLAACPHLKTLVTSRAVLHIQGEHEFPVPPLALPDGTSPLALEELTQYAAIALFLQRALATRPDFDLTTTNGQTIVEICRRLDGLPLAIELAAARIKLLPPQALLQRMIHPLTVLTSGRQNAPERQQTLRNTIAWSYHLLNAIEKQIFRRTSVFVGGCTLEAIEALYSTYPDRAELVLDGVSSLIDKSLLQQTEQQGDQPRLVTLETIREYALEVLSTSGEEEITRQAHAAYYVGLTEEIESRLSGPQQVTLMEQLGREHANLRAALNWLIERAVDGQGGYRIELALRMCRALRRFWIVRGHFHEGQLFLERALAVKADVAPTVRAEALITAANLSVLQSDYIRAEALSQESLALFRALGDRPGTAYSLYLLAWAAWNKASLATTRSFTEESLVIFKELGDSEHIAWSLFTLGMLDSSQGEYARANALFEESLALNKAIGHKRGMAFALLYQARLLFDSQGDQLTLQARLNEALATFRELGDMDGIANSLTLAGQIALRQGDPVKARALLDETTVLYKKMGSRQGTAVSLAEIARVVSAQGDYTAAYTLYKEGLAIAWETKYTWLIAPCLEGMAAVVSKQGAFMRAAQLMGAAESLREAISVPIPPIDRADYERSVAALRTHLGEKDFTSAWKQGRAMSPEQAFTAQSSETVPPLTTTVATPSPTYPAGLTAREIQVLRLLADGLTNSEIARELQLSEKTIAHHLTHIFNKTTSDNRAAAVAFAIRHGLA